jgi:hypothetical protein
MWNPFKKKEEEVIDFVDLEKRGFIKKNIKSEKESEDNGFVDLSSGSETEESSPLGFLGTMAGASETNYLAKQEDSGTTFDYLEYSGEERKKRLVKRLMDMTQKMEQQEKEIYQLQQRLEVLERKIP